MVVINIFSDNIYYKKIDSRTKGLYFIGQHYSFSDIVFFPLYFLKYIKSLFRRKKILKKYKKHGIKEFICFEPNLFEFIKNFKRTLLIYNKIKIKEDVLRIKYFNLEIGDLIYDTYLRMFNRPTLKKDLSLFFLINRTISEINYLENLDLTISEFHTFYTTYTSNGLPLRYYMRKNSKCYSYAYNKDGKLHKNQDYLQAKDFNNYKKNFKNLKNKKKSINKGIDYITSICNGDIRYYYVKKSPFKSKKKLNSSNIKGVVFSHDLFDSQYIFGEMLFPDFYTWLIFTLDFVDKNKLEVGFKEHPNQKKESKYIINKLKKRYKNIMWIDPETSNKEIFNSNIEFGVSVYGSVLVELAFNNIKPICCGDNLSNAYNFTFRAATIDEYKSYLISQKKLKFSNDKQNEIGEFVYMNYLND